MQQREVMDILERHGAILRGHFVGTSGRHLDTYVNKDAIYPHPKVVSRLCRAMALSFTGIVNAVAAPAVGGVILSTWVAHHLGVCGLDCLSLFAEMDDGGRFEFHRGYDRLIEGAEVLVVEDVVTTGGSAKAVLEAVHEAGGTVMGVACLVNRGGVTAEKIGLETDVPFVSLATLDLPSWEAGECPLCREGVSVRTDVGKGREFVEGQGH